MLVLASELNRAEKTSGEGEDNNKAMATVTGMRGVSETTGGPR
jgi:hypothetical protein